MRACRAGLPLTATVPEVGSIRSPMIRSSVDLPQPEGPISETNSPSAISRSIPCSAVVWPNSFVKPAILTTLIRGSPGRGARRASRRARSRGRTRCPEPSRLRRVVLAEVDDLRAEAVRNRRREFADQCAHDAYRGAHLERREDVRKRGREPQLPENPPVARGVGAHQLE